MTRTELTAFRQRLDDMIRRLRGEGAQLRHELLGDERDRESAITQEQYTTDDLSREKADEEVAISVLGAKEELLQECTAALERMAAGRFGLCESCQKPIAKKRLAAVPYARHCIRCARAAEME